MKDGHPYLTAELDQLRATQRRTLRHIPDWILEPGRCEPAVPTITTTPEEVDRALIETLLRASADDLIAEAGEHLSNLANGIGPDRMKVFVQTEVNPAPGKGLEDAQTAIIEATQDNARRAPLVREIEEPLSRLLPRLILLLVWADELAGDYRDPRLPTPGERAG